jgi:anti-sigma factor RsiW
MSCQHAIDQLDEYADQSLGRWARLRVRLHLWICRNCRRYLASYRTTVRLARQAFDRASETTEPPPSEALVAAILAAARSR